MILVKYILPFKSKKFLPDEWEKIIKIIRLWEKGYKSYPRIFFVAKTLFEFSIYLYFVVFRTRVYVLYIPGRRGISNWVCYEGKTIWDEGMVSNVDEYTSHAQRGYDLVLFLFSQGISRNIYKANIELYLLKK